MFKQILVQYNQAYQETKDGKPFCKTYYINFDNINFITINNSSIIINFNLESKYIIFEKENLVEGEFDLIKTILEVNLKNE